MTGIEPVFAAIGSAVTTAAPYVAVGATLLGAASSISAGNQQSAALQENAQVSRANAGTALATAEADTARQQRESQRRLATAANTAAGTGVDISSGSPLDLMTNLAAEGALDEQITRWKGVTQANAYLTQAQQQQRQAGQVRDAGYMQAGTTLLTGLARATSTRYARTVGDY